MEQPETISFEYQGKTYTIYKDPVKSKQHPMEGLWEDREWKRLYHRYTQKLKRKRVKKAERKLPMMCEICGGTYTSVKKHPESVKHQLVLKALELQKDKISKENESV